MKLTRENYKNGLIKFKEKRKEGDETFQCYFHNADVYFAEIQSYAFDSGFIVDEETIAGKISKVVFKCFVEENNTVPQKYMLLNDFIPFKQWLEDGSIYRHPNKLKPPTLPELYEEFKRLHSNG